MPAGRFAAAPWQAAATVDGAVVTPGLTYPVRQQQSGYAQHVSVRAPRSLQTCLLATCLDVSTGVNSSAQLRVLLVEDDGPIAENVVVALGREGIACQHVRFAVDGEAQLRAGSFDLAILDVGLPDGNGFDLCRQIRAFSAIPIVFLTARADEVDRVVGLEIGADDYVLKPFSPRELAARVKAILRRGHWVPLPRGGSAAGGLVVDSERATVSYRGTPLDLSRTEYLMLKAMVERPEKVFSRAVLMDAAGLAESSLERSVDTHIKSLRAKLAAVAPEVEPIRTHRGLGYSIINC